MKLFDFMKKRKVEEKNQSEIKEVTENSSNDEKTVKVEAAPPSSELYFDDNDIGYC